MAAEQLRTRRQTRAAVLDRLLATGGLFRPQLATDCNLTEVSISRILADLREEGLVEEIRRPAPYPGGPTQIVTLAQDQWIAGLTLANRRLSFGTATLGGDIAYLERLPLADLTDRPALAATFAQAIDALCRWCGARGVVPLRIGVSIPGLREPPDAPNPITALDAAAISAMLEAAFPTVPHGLVNAVAARAAAHLFGPGSEPIATRHLFVHLGRGIGGAWVEPVTAAAPIRPIEFGHVVVERHGPACRCGHRGCLETFASAGAIGRIFGVPEAEMIAADNDWLRLVRMTARRRVLMADALHRVGLAIGNVLNIMPVSLVAISGWPSTLPEDQRTALRQGIEDSVFGGTAALQVPLRFLPSTLGSDPRPALAWAMHELVRDGGLAPRREEARRVAG
ncbi:ROK family transcriptional regulator [Falsiroseomonas oryziterrae]|uniref:ROK family transcriptional regulator n=1 Tax=Falsiroseomonas oryziterrae TaxID=2911368 RepID=UPI001F3F98B3|nr:ROK family transcriptional regulator [Roseomonas sp. NPKOSM-4]